MTFTIGPECIDRTDRSCLDVCPVDCIYIGRRKLYIHRDECIDCGACAPVCPHDAINRADDLDGPELLEFAEDEVRFFTQPLPGRAEPIGSPGSSVDLGPLGTDTDLVRFAPAARAR